MEDPDITDACSKECLPNCGEITYSYEMDTTDLEVDPLCHHQQDTRDVRKEDYRVKHLLADLGWVDLDLECSTFMLGQ